VSLTCGRATARDVDVDLSTGAAVPLAAICPTDDGRLREFALLAVYAVVVVAIVV
jgi:hypothetical protein